MVPLQVTFRLAATTSYPSSSSLSLNSKITLAPNRGLLSPTASIDIAILVGDHKNAASIYLPTCAAHRRGIWAEDTEHVGATPKNRTALRRRTQPLTPSIQWSSAPPFIPSTLTRLSPQLDANPVAVPFAATHEPSHAPGAAVRQNDPSDVQFCSLHLVPGGRQYSALGGDNDACPPNPTLAVCGDLPRESGMSRFGQLALLGRQLATALSAFAEFDEIEFARTLVREPCGYENFMDAPTTPSGRGVHGGFRPGP